MEYVRERACKSVVAVVVDAAHERRRRSFVMVVLFVYSHRSYAHIYIQHHTKHNILSADSRHGIGPFGIQTGSQ